MRRRQQRGRQRRRRQDGPGHGATATATRDAPPLLRALAPFALVLGAAPEVGAVVRRLEEQHATVARAHEARLVGSQAAAHAHVRGVVGAAACAERLPEVEARVHLRHGRWWRRAVGMGVSGATLGPVARGGSASALRSVIVRAFEPFERLAGSAEHEAARPSSAVAMRRAGGGTSERCAARARGSASGPFAIARGCERSRRRRHAASPRSKRRFSATQSLRCPINRQDRKTTCI